MNIIIKAYYCEENVFFFNRFVFLENNPLQCPCDSLNFEVFKLFISSSNYIHSSKGVENLIHRWTFSKKKVFFESNLSRIKRAKSGLNASLIHCKSNGTCFDVAFELVYLLFLRDVNLKSCTTPKIIAINPLLTHVFFLLFIS